ncbi:hypothetical protein BX600DRAFT_501424 [Xylariales sp. PMI_506]|nr:hypothetical protein BX600DRAFT_501424 [Xylariales sp. PMI_506]
MAEMVLQRTPAVPINAGLWCIYVQECVCLCFLGVGKKTIAQGQLGSYLINMYLKNLRVDIWTDLQLLSPPTPECEGLSTNLMYPLPLPWDTTLEGEIPPGGQEESEQAAQLRSGLRHPLSHKDVAPELVVDAATTRRKEGLKPYDGGQAASFPGAQLMIIGQPCATST